MESKVEKTKQMAIQLCKRQIVLICTININVKLTRLATQLLGFLIHGLLLKYRVIQKIGTTLNIYKPQNNKDKTMQFAPNGRERSSISYDENKTKKSFNKCKCFSKRACLKLSLLSILKNAFYQYVSQPYHNKCCLTL